MKQESQPSQAEQARQEYTKPVLQRWGSLREMTLGGGGTRGEPASKRKTRF